MGNSLLKTDYLTALNASSVGQGIGIKLTQAEAERVFFPFYDGNEVLRDANNAVAYCLKNEGEFVYYELVDKGTDEYADFSETRLLSFDKQAFLGQIGELVECGIILLNGADCTVTFLTRSDYSKVQNHFLNPTDLTLEVSPQNRKASTNMLTFRGSSLGYSLSTNDNTCRVVTYAKIKPRSLIFDFVQQNTANEQVFSMPFLGGDFYLNEVWVMSLSGSYSSNNYNLYKAAPTYGNSYILYKVQGSGSDYLNASQWYRAVLNNEHSAKRNVQYGDRYWLQFADSTKRSYRLRMRFEFGNVIG